MTAPPGWEGLRGAVGGMRDDLLALVARTDVWQHLDDRRRRGYANLAAQVATSSSALGTVATLVRAEARPDGAPFLAAITLTWFRTAPLLADLDLAALVAGAPRVRTDPSSGAPVADADGGHEVVDTGLGPALASRFVEDSPAGTPVVTTQVHAPVPGSIWLAVLTGLALEEADAEAMDDGVLALAASLTVDRPAPRTGLQAGLVDRLEHGPAFDDLELDRDRTGPRDADIASEGRPLDRFEGPPTA